MGEESEIVLVRLWLVFSELLVVDLSATVMDVSETASRFGT